MNKRISVYDALHSKRRGATMLIALVLVMIVASTCAALVSRIYTYSKEAKGELAKVQAEQLAYAGTMLAKQRLLAEKDYVGGEWTDTVPTVAPSLATGADDVCKMDVTVSKPTPGSWKISSRASLRIQSSGSVYTATRYIVVTQAKE